MPLLRARRRHVATAALAVLAVVAVPVIAGATTTYPPMQGGSHDYRDLHIKNGSCDGPLDPATQHPAGSDLPPGFRCKGSQKLTSYAPQPGDADYDPTVENNPQELMGVKGASTNLAWQTTTGRPDTIISVLDSGIRWNTPNLVNKVEINLGELPPPCAAGTAIADCNSTYGDGHATYDTNDDGVFSVGDYNGDPRIAAAVPESASRGYLTPEDLIRTFSDGVDHDGNGYPNDIAGWDFYQHDNDPADDVDYGHGTGEAQDSTAESTASSISECPNCRVLPLRVGDSFIADINHFAAAVIYATDNHVDVVQEALGTLNHSAFAQTAVDYAYHHGVLIVASEADESAGHHNYPAALNHTMVVNSVTHFADQDGVPLQLPKTYLAFNGCTNYGGYTWVSVESNSCSSDATGQAAGMAGLLYSAAQNAVENGLIKPDPSGRPLSAEAAKQLFRLAADDVDFSDPAPPVGPPNNFLTTLPDSVRYVTTGGWNQITGWARLNADKLVRAVANVPGQADITSPRWWTPLPTTGSVPLIGSVAAPASSISGASSYTYDVEVAPGVQPAPFPATDSWTTIAHGAGDQAKTGKLATLDLAQIRSLIDGAVPAYTPANDPTSVDMPEKDAFRVRVVVHTPGAPDAIEQRQYFDSADTNLLKAFPKYVDADATSIAFADIDGDGKSEMVFGDGNGNVHAMKADGSEARGWPQQTGRLSWLPRTGHNAFTTGAVTGDVHAPLLLGSPLVTDLDHDGYPEVTVTDIEGELHSWDHNGHERPGFPVHTNPAWSHDPGCETAIGPICDHYVTHHVRDYHNTVDKAFAGMPSAGDLDKSYPGLEIVAGAMDGHMYAFHADGTPVPGWPVLLHDPSKVANVDPVSDRITLIGGNTEDDGAYYGRQVITTPTIADLTGDGTPEVVTNVDEEYAETPNYGMRSPTVDAHGNSGALTDGNTRIYALWADGSNHPSKAPATAMGANAHAYMPGWPVKIGMVQSQLLPDVGSGAAGSPVVGHITPGSTAPQIATASIASPPYLLNVDGTSAYGTDPQGHYLTMASEEGHGAGHDLPAIASLGGGALGHLGGPSSPMSFAMGATGLKRLLDVVLPDQQLGAEDYVGAWNGATGTFDAGFPARMNDLQFFNSPAIADVDGSGLPSVLQGSAMYDLRGYKLGGVAATGFPKFTGGWITQTPSVGDVVGGGGLELAVPSREGNVFVWRTGGTACGDLEWPKFQHDLHNSGDYDTDATPPGVLRGATLAGGSVHVTASGDNGYCSGAAKDYVVTVDGVQHVLPTAPAAAGSPQTLDVASLIAGADTVSISEEDAAGNLSYPVVLRGDAHHGKSDESHGKSGEAHGNGDGQGS